MESRLKTKDLLQVRIGSGRVPREDSSDELNKLGLREAYVGTIDRDVDDSSDFRLHVGKRVRRHLLSTALDEGPSATPLDLVRNQEGDRAISTRVLRIGITGDSARERNGRTDSNSLGICKCHWSSSGCCTNRAIDRGTVVR